MRGVGGTINTEPDRQAHAKEGEGGGLSLGQEEREGSFRAGEEERLVSMRRSGPLGTPSSSYLPCS